MDAVILSLSTGLLVGPALANDNDFDFRPITFKPGPHSRIDRPVVSWEVSNDPFSHCEIATTPTRGGTRYSTACMTWDLTENTCSIFTTSKTSHTQLGRLLITCMEKS